MITTTTVPAPVAPVLAQAEATAEEAAPILAAVAANVALPAGKTFDQVTGISASKLPNGKWRLMCRIVE